jgi:hypothetical protein
LGLSELADLKEQFIRLAFFHQYPKFAAENRNVPTAIVVQSLDAKSAEAGLIFLESAFNETPQDPEARALALYKRLHPFDENHQESFVRLLEDSSCTHSLDRHLSPWAIQLMCPDFSTGSGQDQPTPCRARRGFQTTGKQ